jgi:hypothetical protein
VFLALPQLPPREERAEVQRLLLESETGGEQRKGSTGPAGAPTYGVDGSRYMGMPMPKRHEGERRGERIPWGELREAQALKVRDRIAPSLISGTGGMDISMAVILDREREDFLNLRLDQRWGEAH